MLMLLAASLCWGDQWKLPPPYWSSEDGKLRLGVTRSSDRKIHLTLSRKEVGKWHKVWSRLSPQTREPYKVHFSLDGQSIVLQDQWHEIGYGKVLVFLGSQGREIRSYTLDDLLSKEEQRKYMTTISSHWWVHGLRIGMLPDGKSFGLVTKFGSGRSFDLATGKMQKPTKTLTDRLRRELGTDKPHV